ncbi:DUF4407 domain-containing protein [Micromonospora zingiberis]|uniref:DUF4407 domain-containing protein n=1 Tax=Micromonospora zingiberis TaxID=2053011 RepID=A0A4R0GV43_9ACTN|nr:DUF4407 domain-containing protein [Micromonospora zingiberis]TCB99631.1 DUF4407 domain-containing protein [Micromonospora zingiberis]
MISKFFVWLAAADADILEQCPSERHRYQTTGAAVLVTAFLGAVSGTFALTTAMDLDLAWAVLAGLLWGLAVLTIDRMLIAGVTRRPSAYANLIAALPRLALAMLIGAVISTPLVLRIFESEIETQLEINHRVAQEAFNRALAEDPRFTAIPTLKARVDELQAVVNGTGGTNVEDDPTVNRLSQEYQRLSRAYEAADKAVVCEKEGKCGSGRVGAGPAYREKVERRGRLATERQQAREQLATARTNAERIRAEERKSADTDLETARGELDRIEQIRRDEEDSFSARLSADDGLLARIDALDDLRDRDATLGAAYLALILLITALEMLPVLAKLLVFLGPVTAYERIRELRETRDVQRFRTENLILEEEENARLRAGASAATEKAERELRAHVELHGLLVDRWRREQLDQIERNPAQFLA